MRKKNRAAQFVDEALLLLVRGSANDHCSRNKTASKG